MAHQDKSAFWDNHIKAWKVSGLSQKAYAEKHSLKAHQISYYNTHQRRLERETNTENSSSEGFIFPIQVTKPSSPLVLKLPQGVSIQIEEGFNPQLLKQVIDALGSSS